MSKTLILIDGHALAFRQYYALERTNMQTKDGTPTWAVYGFFKAIFDLLKNKDLAPDAIGVAFDVSHHTFRTEEYEEYKSNREAMPDAMRIQMELIYAGLRAFNIPIYTKEGFEADDVIGTISRRACELGHQVYILTGDQDSFQLIRENGCIKVIIPSKGDLIEYNWQKVHDKLGVWPNQVIDYKALRGDTSDNIPGIKGIGEKTAVKLLEEFGTVDNVLNSVDKITQKSLKEKIQTGVEIAKLSKHLATIVQDVDIDFDFEKTKIELPDISDVTEFLRGMQFYSFIKNIEFILKLFNKDYTPNESNSIETSTIIEQPIAQNGQLGLFAQAVQAEVNKEENIEPAKCISSTQDLKELIAQITNNGLFAFKSFVEKTSVIDIKYYGIAIGLNKGVKYSDKLSFADDQYSSVYYIPFSNELNQVEIISALKQVFESKEIKTITHDIGFEYICLKSLGINIKNCIFDTMLACYIKDSNANSSFDIQCMEQIDHILPTMVNNKKDNFITDVPTAQTYTTDVLSSLFNLTKHWVELLEEKERSLLLDIEIPLAYVLAKMEITGVSIDKNYLNILTSDFNKKINDLELKIYDIAGQQFNINSPKQVGEILYDKLQISTKKRGKAKKSTSVEVLTALAQEYEIAALIIEYRKYAKLKSTYTEALPALINSKDNRIHTTYNQTTTTTGRLSSSNPNLQNIPIRTPEGNKIRQAFTSSDKENYLILSADYSQIELRLLAHVSGDANLINAFQSEIDVHTLTASKIFGVSINDVTKEMRYSAKAVNFGIIYGQSKYGLAKVLKITPAEAEGFISNYFLTYPRIKDYMLNMVELVEKQGYVETIFGRRRYLEKEINSPNAMIREFAKRAAINHPMQGSASDLIKKAMIDFSSKLETNNLSSKLIIQVHDELVVETKKSELEKIKALVKTSMELNQPLQVPLLIDINVGESWKES